MNEIPKIFNDPELFGEAIRGRFPELIDVASDGEVQQEGDAELVIWNGYGFRIHLSNGAAFNIQITQDTFAKLDEDEDEW